MISNWNVFSESKHFVEVGLKCLDSEKLGNFLTKTSI
jgi:hypothetical protein